MNLSLEEDGPIAEKTGLPGGKYKEKDKGTGLGLAVVHGIIHSHHGAILAQSSPGKDSVSRVLLPAILEAPLLQGAPVLSDSISRRKRRNGPLCK